MVTIRKATPKDSEGIAKVQVQSWRETYAGLVPDSYLAGLKISERTAGWQTKLTKRTGRYFTFVAEERSEIVGFIDGGSARQPESGFGSELAAFYLLKVAQGKGIGKTLFTTFTDSLKQDGFKDMYLWVLSGNPTKGFYEKMGGRSKLKAIVEIGGVDLPEEMYVWEF